MGLSVAEWMSQLKDSMVLDLAETDAQGAFAIDGSPAFSPVLPLSHLTLRLEKAGEEVRPCRVANHPRILRNQ